MMHCNFSVKEKITKKLMYCYSLMKERKVKTTQDELKVLPLFHTRRNQHGHWVTSYWLCDQRTVHRDAVVLGVKNYSREKKELEGDVHSSYLERGRQRRKLLSPHEESNVYPLSHKESTMTHAKTRSIRDTCSAYSYDKECQNALCVNRIRQRQEN